MNTQIIEFQKHTDDRGDLVIAEYDKEIPFIVKRVYYIYGVEKDKERGFHSHKNLQQIYIGIAGSCKVMLDDGNQTKTVVLDNPSNGLYIGNGVWRKIFDFSSDAILLVLASENYNEDDYIRSYDEFIESIS